MDFSGMHEAGARPVFKRIPRQERPCRGKASVLPKLSGFCGLRRRRGWNLRRRGRRRRSSNGRIRPSCVLRRKSGPRRRRGLRRRSRRDGMQAGTHRPSRRGGIRQARNLRRSRPGMGGAEGAEEEAGAAKQAGGVRAGVRTPSPAAGAAGQRGAGAADGVSRTRTPG